MKFEYKIYFLSTILFPYFYNLSVKLLHFDDLFFLKMAHKTRTERIIFLQCGGGVLSRLSTADCAAAEKEETYSFNFC